MTMIFNQTNQNLQSIDPVARENAERAQAREQVRRAASRGRAPLETLSRPSLDWAYGDEHRFELDDAIATAAQVRAERDAQADRQRQALALRRATDQVMSEWRAASRTSCDSGLRPRPNGGSAWRTAPDASAHRKGVGRGSKSALSVGRRA